MTLLCVSTLYTQEMSAPLVPILFIEGQESRQCSAVNMLNIQRARLYIDQRI